MSTPRTLMRLPVWLLAAVAPFTAAHAADASAAIQAASPSCAARIHTTAAGLAACIQAPSVWRHLVAFQQISDQNPGKDGHGNRDTGSAGYQASVKYVADQMRAAGYRVTLQTYRYTATEIVGVPRLQLAGRALTLNHDWSIARLSAGGTLSAPLQPASGTGTACVAGELAGFVPGRIALLQRGACAHALQVAHAQAAGAAAVLLYNDADSDGAPAPRLSRQAALPVLALHSHALGAELRARSLAGEPAELAVDIRTRAKPGNDYNLVAESPFGDPQHVVVVDAHLDSIYGAGILDNASGSSTALEIALQMAATPTLNQLRYVWFGGEEIGLLGSAYYTRNLSAAERLRIAFDIDVDVTATPNFDYLVADPAQASNVSRFPPNVVPDSQVGNQFFADAFAALGVPSQPAWFGNDGTDSNSFSLIGIPNTGVLTQQDCCKKSWEVGVWGGSTGNYEGKLHSSNGGCVDLPRRWCDNLSNNDPGVLDVATKATAQVVFNLANHPFATRPGSAP